MPFGNGEPLSKNEHQTDITPEKPRRCGAFLVDEIYDVMEPEPTFVQCASERLTAEEFGSK